MAPRRDFNTQYERVGAALITYERHSAFSIFSHFIDAHAFEEFRTDVAATSTGVLESYLDDLLGEKIADELLFIEMSLFSRNKLIELLSLVGAIAAVAVGTHLSFSGTDPWWAFGVALGLGSPFALFFHTVFGHTNRRVKLARVVSFELSRRRGDTHDTTGGNKVSFRQMLNPLNSPVTAPSQKVIFH